MGPYLKRKKKMPVKHKGHRTCQYNSRSIGTTIRAIKTKIIRAPQDHHWQLLTIILHGISSLVTSCSCFGRVRLQKYWGSISCRHTRARGRTWLKGGFVGSAVAGVADWSPSSWGSAGWRLESWQTLTSLRKTTLMIGALRKTGENMDPRLQRLVACGHKARTTCWSSSHTDP